MTNKQRALFAAAEGAFSGTKDRFFTIFMVCGKIWGYIREGLLDEKMVFLRRAAHERIEERMDTDNEID